MEEMQTPWEDHLLERKTDRELADIRRTAVAFANSVMPGHTAVILIGEGNDGNVSGVDNPDEQQRKVRRELEKIYPSIIWRQQVYAKGDKACIRIEIEYRGETPHFADAAWIRQGSETIRASDAMLQKLVEFRSSKVRELAKWLGKVITVSWSLQQRLDLGPNWNRIECKVVNVESHFSTFKVVNSGTQKSEPNGWLDLSWDDLSNRLRVFVDPQRSSFG
jgi:hypothetical protein